MKEERTKFLVWAISLFALLFWLHSDHIRADVALAYDDHILVTPLKQISSVPEYFERLMSGTIWERQPVKDLSIMADYWLQEKLPAWSLHGTNMVIWYLVVLLTYFICRLWFAFLPTVLVTSLLAVHPLALNCIGWLSARKHLLAALFLTSCTLVFLRALRSSKLSALNFVLILILFSLAGLSQMIVVAYPLWMIYHLISSLSAQPNIQRRPFIFCICGVGIISTLIFMWNYDYYLNVFPTLSTEGGNKMGSTTDDAGFRVLALGGYFSRIILPFWPSTTPIYPGSARNIIGIVALVFSFFGIYKLVKKETLLSFSLYMAVPLLPVTVKITNVFASGTYLLNTLVGFTILMGFAIKDHIEKFKKPFLGAALVLFCLFGILTKTFSTAWTSDYEFWRMSAEAEANAQNLAQYGQELYNRRLYKQAVEAGLRAQAIEPNNHYVSHLLSKATYADREISIERKVDFLNTLQTKGAWWFYFMTFLQFEQGHFQTAFEVAKNGMKDKTQFAREIKGDLESVTAEYTRICELAKHADCQSIAAGMRELKPDWNEKQFMDIKNEFDRATQPATE